MDDQMSPKPISPPPPRVSQYRMEMSWEKTKTLLGRHKAAEQLLLFPPNGDDEEGRHS